MSDPKDKHNREMLALIDAQLEIAKHAIKEAMKIADKNGLCFSLEPPDMRYHAGEGTGVGVTYYGEGHPTRKNTTGRYGEPYEDGWLPSNITC